MKKIRTLSKDPNLDPLTLTAVPGGPEFGLSFDAGTGASVMRPMLFPKSSVNQSLPSGPAVMPMGRLPLVGTENSVTVPVTVIRPILSSFGSVNQSLPSGPAVMLQRPLWVVGTGNSVTTP